MWLSTNLCSRQLSLLAHPECPWVCHSVKDPPQWLLGASCSTSRFLSPSFYSPSLCNSTSLLPCHSLIFLSLLSFESPVSLFYFPVVIPPLLSCVLCAVMSWRLPCMCVVLQRPGSWCGGWANVALPYHPLPILTSLPFRCHISHSSSSLLYFPFHLACISPSLSLPVASENDG